MSRENVRIVIIGAGIGGLSAGIALKRKFNYSNFVIYEKAGDIGGTWRDNTYPGCACDVPSHWYSLSTDPNPNWKKEFVNHQEIFRYWKDLVTKYKLGPHLQFNQQVDECKWDPDRQLYHLRLSNTGTGTGTLENQGRKAFEDSARVVISAVGGFLNPRFAPDLPGRGVFKGDMWHSGRWNHEISLSGKSIGVIGNGCSTVQFLPIISKDESTKIVNFCRSPHYMFPLPQFDIGPVMRWMFNYVPFFLLWYRFLIYSRADVMYLAFPLHIHWLRSILTWFSTRYIQRTAPKKYHQYLIPKYKIGCKRTIFDPGYLLALHRPNVSLDWDGIEHITAKGIITKTGKEYEFDVIIFATGFEIMSHGMRVIGSNEQTLDEYWETQDGPTAYFGTTMPGFPNFFSVLGPNTITGHASVIYTEEVQINYILRMIEPILQGRVKSFNLKPAASNAYNDEIQSRLRNSVYSTCLSWYRGGSAHNEKNIASYPGFHAQLWWNMLVPRWEDYQASGVTNWRPAGKITAVFRSLFIL